MEDKASNLIEIPLDKPILLFDGVCNLCNNSVQFIIKRDAKAKIRFASLQSATGQQLLQQLGYPQEDFDTAILVDNGKVYDRSSVGLQVARKMDGLWPLAYIFIILPKPVRDIVYNWIAKNRYKWFGKEESCMMPSPDLRNRFI